MKITRIAAIAATIASIALASVALSALTVHLIAGGQLHTVRAVQVGGAWYVSASDVAHALGNGASFDVAKRTLYASASDRNSQMHTADKAGGGFATDGTIAVRLVSIKQDALFQGNAPDPGAHFVKAVLAFKNVSSAPVPMYQVQTSLLAAGKHLNDGQLYDESSNDLSDTQVAPGQTVTYLDVFELNDGDTADALLVHPPFVPSTGPVDITLKLQ